MFKGVKIFFYLTIKIETVNTFQDIIIPYLYNNGSNVGKICFD